MQHTNKSIKTIPDYVKGINTNEDIKQIYLEQLRVKEYSKKINKIDGARKVYIPWSGGLDSTTSLLMALETDVEVETVTFDYGQPYVAKEQSAMESLTKTILKEYKNASSSWKKHHIIDVKWLDKELKGMFDGKWEHIFPLRNFVIILETSKMINSEYAEIWFSCVKGEMPFSGGDKSVVFLTEIEKILANKNTLFATPFIGLSKTDLVFWGNTNNKRSNIIHQTVSCFDANGTEHCGKCKACFVRGVAFYAANNIKNVGYIPNGKHLSNQIKEYEKRILSSDHYSDQRQESILSYISFLKKREY